MTPKTFEYSLQKKKYPIVTFGQVKKSKYLEILEEARWYLITKNGY